MSGLHALDSLRGHSLVPTDAELASIPALYATDGLPFARKVIHLRYFAGGSAQWLIAEIDRDSWLMFGYCDLGLGFPEWGYVSLEELCALRARSPHGLPVYAERDLYWTPTMFDHCDVG